ncbi:transcriptional regulator [Granulicatella balaenopterae]|uniref:Transcriptional regulator n=1 Tax=Granulicatella balaenopterae TaxID=137733 RepID=A0A1H9M6W7_9LACT|nr:Rgg/GadR/MutR family transcriptional regulator [Granulicatella balaenopterae]SER19217.1 transcriptional regulator [Granulicatella balaenopterae]
MTYYGELINQIRKQKNLSVSYLTEGILSKSQYYKFIANTSEISISKFDKLLARLAISSNEFYHLYQEQQQIITLPVIMKTFEQQDVSTLIHLHTQLEQQYLEHNNIQDHHLLIITTALIKRLQQDTSPNPDTLIIKKYLLNVEVWSYYEISLLSNTLFMFDYSDVQLLSQQLISKAKKLTFQQNSLVKIISNLLILKIQHNDYREFDKLINYLKKCNIQTLEAQILLYFWQQVYLYTVLNNKDALNNLHHLVDYLKQLQIAPLVYLLENIISQLPLQDS